MLTATRSATSLRPGQGTAGNFGSMLRRTLLPLGLFALLVPATAGAQAELYPVIDSHGAVYAIPGGTLIVATGQASAIGLSEGGGYRSHVGWLRAFFARIDGTPPTVTPPDDLTVERSTCIGAVLGVPEPQVQDNRDPNPDVFVAIPALGVNNTPLLLLGDVEFPLGGTQVNFTAVDQRGNEATASMLVTVQDTVDPGIVAQAAFEAEATNPNGSILILPQPAIDGVCANQVAVTSNAPARFPLGDTVVTWTATDDAGNSATDITTVTVVDTQPPLISLANARLEVDGCAGAPVELPPPVVRDNSTPTNLIVISNDAPDVFPLGETTVTYTATDLAGLTNTAQLIVEVQDRGRPSVVLVAVPDGYTNGDATITFTVNDACDGNPTAALDPVPDSLTPQGGGTYAAVYSAAGLHDVTITGEDAAGNRTTRSGILFGIDLDAPTGELTAIEVPADLGRPTTWPVYYRGEDFAAVFSGSDGQGDGASGLGRVTGSLLRVDPDNNNAELERWALIDEQFPRAGLPPRGALSKKNMACELGDLCDVRTGQLRLDRIELGSYMIELVVTDTAGNSSSQRFPFHNSNLLMAIRTATLHVEPLLAVDPDPAWNPDPRLPLGPVPNLLGYSAGGGHKGAYLAMSNGLLGSTLMYLYDVAKSMVRAHHAGTDFDLGREMDYLSRGAQAEVALFRSNLIREWGPNADSDRAGEHLELASAAREVAMFPGNGYGDAPGTWLPIYPELQHALFYSQSHERPLWIYQDLDEREARDLLRDLLEMTQDYIDIADATGRDCANEARAHLVTADQLADAEGNYNQNAVNLMLELNEAALVLQICQEPPDYLWARYWQWGTVLVVKSYVQRGRYAAGGETDCGFEPDDPGCHQRHPLMGEAYCRYQYGVEFFNRREVDNALDVYIQAKCMMVELYNYAFADDAIAVPPECAGDNTFTCYDQAANECRPECLHEPLPN